MTQKLLIIATGLFVLSLGTVKAQDNVKPKPDSIYSKVDVLPEFPGGMKALAKYVDGKNHHYPKEARDNKIEGKVIVQFIINEDGTPSDFKVIQGIGYGCDEAAVEAFKKMPKWKPATINGQPVNCGRRWDICINYEFVLSYWVSVVLKYCSIPYPQNVVFFFLMKFSP